MLEFTYIEENRAIDNVSKRMTTVFMSAVKIRINKHIHCPGNRKLAKVIKKQLGCVIRYLGEFNTSQNTFNQFHETHEAIDSRLNRNFIHLIVVCFLNLYRCDSRCAMLVFLRWMLTPWTNVSWAEYRKRAIPNVQNKKLHFRWP